MGRSHKTGILMALVVASLLHRRTVICLKEASSVIVLVLALLPAILAFYAGNTSNALYAQMSATQYVEILLGTLSTRKHLPACVHSLWWYGCCRQRAHAVQMPSSAASQAVACSLVLHKDIMRPFVCSRITCRFSRFFWFVLFSTVVIFNM